MLLPCWLLARRCDDGVMVIGDMLARAARGQGFRSVAAVTGVPAWTVRDRLRRFRSSAGRVREFFTRLAYALAVDPVPLEPAGGGLADAVVAVAAAAGAARGRWPAIAVSGWEMASAATRGSLLSPSLLPVRSRDGSPVFALV